MPLTKEQEEKLREEFDSYTEWDLYDPFTPGDKRNFAGWWISKINEALEAQRKEIVEKFKGMCDLTHTGECKYFRSDIHTNLLDGAKFVAQEILEELIQDNSLPQLTGKQEEDGN